MVTREDAERVVERDMQFEIAYDGDRFDRAAVTGEVLVAAAPSSPAAKAIKRVADSIAAEYKHDAGEKSADG